MKLIILSLIFILLYFNVYANEKNSSIRNKNFQIQTIIYSSLGRGLSLSYEFYKNIWLNLDAQSLSGNMSIESNEGATTENSDYEFQTKYLNLRYFLTSIIEELFFQYGFVSQKWHSESIVVSNENGQKKAIYKTNYPTKGINLGVGMNWVLNNGFSSGLYLVRIISEEPSFIYEIETDWECLSSCRSNYESNVKKYTPINSFYLNLGYNF